MLPCLCQHLDCDVIRNQVLFDQSAQERVFCLGCGGESYLDLLESHLYQVFEKLYFFIQAHRDDQRLVSIPKIHAAPVRSFCYVLFSGPVKTLFRRHKVLAFIFF